MERLNCTFSCCRTLCECLQPRKLNDIALEHSLRHRTINLRDNVHVVLSQLLFHSAFLPTLFAIIGHFTIVYGSKTEGEVGAVKSI